MEEKHVHGVVSECVFCQIVDGTAKSDIVFDGGDTLVFKDVSPQAPVHLVAIPKQHLESLDSMRGDDHALIGKLMHEIADVAADIGIKEDGYRVITNVGKNAGQEIEHLHFHVLGGEPLGPIRC